MHVRRTVVSYIVRAMRAASAETCVGVRCACLLFLPDIHTTVCMLVVLDCALHRSCCARGIFGGMRLIGWKLAHAREIKKKISVAIILRATFFTFLFSGTGQMDSPGK